MQLFFSQFAEPDSEGEDALAQTDWNHLLCPCGKPHREAFYAFPPVGLIPSSIRTAAADKARGVLTVLVPFTITAPFWSRLKTGPEPFYSLSEPAAAFRHAGSFKTFAVALFALDFDPTLRGSSAHFAPP